MINLEKEIRQQPDVLSGIEEANREKITALATSTQINKTTRK